MNAPRLLLALAFLAPACGLELRADGPNFDRKEDVIYGRKFGTALTMDVFTPKHGANGAAVVLVVSGGSSRPTRRSIRSSSGRWSIVAIRCSRSSTGASPDSRCRRSSRT